jgi:ABC-type spermidine/putrescine transport system permease subunit I
MVAAAIPAWGARRPRVWTPGRGYYLLLALPSAFLAVFFLWPLARVVLRSVTEPRFGLGNYERVFFTGPFLRVLLNTVEISVSVTVICLVLAYPVAWCLSRAQGSLLRLATGLVLIPLWTSVVIRGYAWMILFQRNGVVNQALQSAGLIDEPLRILQTSTAVQIGMVHVLLPFMILPLLATMRSIDATLLRAGQILGAGPVRLFLRVYLPLSLPGVSAGVALVFITALGFYVTPSLLGGAKSTMVAVLIEQQASTYFDWPLASALATVLLVATGAIYLVYIRLVQPRGVVR